MPHSPGVPEQTASLQVASADSGAVDLIASSAMPSVAPDEPAQKETHAGAIIAPAAAAPVSPGGETGEPEQASANEPSTLAAPEATGAVNVASVANDPVQDAGLIDLNKASVQQLNGLRNVGPLGRAIAKGRPYASVDDLVKRKVVRRSVYEKIKDQVTVR